jgi:plasmid stabilization system protein ParE
MAKRRIIWSNRAKKKRFEILKFYTENNKSNTYSKKLNQKFNKEIRLLTEYPNLGIKTDFIGIRGLIIDHFIIFYENNYNKIIIHTIWDSRQNPENLHIKK